MTHHDIEPYTEVTMGMDDDDDGKPCRQLNWYAWLLLIVLKFLTMHKARDKP